jgi:hypothetical protein
MRKHLQIAKMLTVGTAIATSLSFYPAQLSAETAGDSVQTITTNEENGRKVYVNEAIPANRVHRAQTADTPKRSLMYWSVKENR